MDLDHAAKPGRREGDRDCIFEGVIVEAWAELNDGLRPRLRIVGDGEIIASRHLGERLIGSEDQPTGGPSSSSAPVAE